MIPNEFIAGTTLEFVIEPIERLTTDGYSYEFRLGGNKLSTSSTGVVSGYNVRFKLTPANTANFTTGIYFYQILATRAGDVYLLDSGRIGVNRIVAGEFDGRSVAERIVDAIDALLEGRATTDQQSYAIASGAGSRSLSRIPVLELKELRKVYAAQVVAERKFKNGEGLFRTHRVSFVSPS